MRLIPPMDEEPPPDYVEFVRLHAAELRAEAARTTGGGSVCTVSEGLYQSILTELAGHWRRLRWWGRITRSEAAETYARRRLAARSAQWREDQIYQVEVRVLRPPEPMAPAVPVSAPGGSLALRKAAVLSGTARASLDALADAEIAWVHACLRSQWRRLLRFTIGCLLLIGTLIQYLAWLSPDSR